MPTSETKMTTWSEDGLAWWKRAVLKVLFEIHHTPMEWYYKLTDRWCELVPIASNRIDDGNRPHREPAGRTEPLAWKCQACKQWVSEPPTTDCPIDWRNP